MVSSRRLVILSIPFQDGGVVLTKNCEVSIFLSYTGLKRRPLIKTDSVLGFLQAFWDSEANFLVFCSKIRMLY